MRELKFRAFDVNENMTYFELNPETLLKGVKDLKSIIKQEEGYHLMQYTGLKDKNGVEVYEGDVVKYPNIDGEFNICEVKYLNGTPIYKDIYSGNEEYICLYIGSIDTDEESEVIGNIFQNPELLESSK